jgi:hypothetical protein
MPTTSIWTANQPDRAHTAVQNVANVTSQLLRQASLSLRQQHNYFFLPATVFGLPLRVRALVFVRWPRVGRPCRAQIKAGGRTRYTQSGSSPKHRTITVLSANLVVKQAERMM